LSRYNPAYTLDTVRITVISLSVLSLIKYLIYIPHRFFNLLFFLIYIYIYFLLETNQRDFLFFLSFFLMLNIPIWTNEILGELILFGAHFFLCKLNFFLLILYSYFVLLITVTVKTILFLKEIYSSIWISALILSLLSLLAIVISCFVICQLRTMTQQKNIYLKNEFLHVMKKIICLKIFSFFSY
jgi:hypothetical protein